MLFSWTFFLCGVTFWASLRCGKAYGSSKLLLQLNFFTICSLSALARLLPSACFWFPSAHTAPETAKSVVAHRIWIRWRLRVLQKSKVPTVLDIALNSSHKDQWMRMFFFCYFLPNRGSWRQPRSSCVPPPTYHPQRPESHEESPSYSWYKNAYFRSFLKTDSPIGCIVTLHWLHDRAFGTLSLRENDLSSIFVRYFIHIRSGVRCEKYYGSSMFVLERPLSSACIGFH